MNIHRIADLVEASLHLPQLVTIEHRSNEPLVAVFRDPDNESFRYDFALPSAGSALRWISHMAKKTWVTKEHLEQFAALVADEFEIPHQ